MLKLLTNHGGLRVNHFANVLGLGVNELLIILVILVLLFGAKKLPELAKSVGSSVKELRKGVKDDADSTPNSKQ